MPAMALDQFSICVGMAIGIVATLLALLILFSTASAGGYRPRGRSAYWGSGPHRICIRELSGIVTDRNGRRYSIQLLNTHLSRESFDAELAKIQHDLDVSNAFMIPHDYRCIPLPVGGSCVALPKPPHPPIQEFTRETGDLK